MKQIFQKINKKAITIVHRVKGKEVENHYFIFGKEVPFHEFKQRIKRINPITIITIDE